MNRLVAFGGDASYLSPVAGQVTPMNATTTASPHPHHFITPFVIRNGTESVVNEHYEGYFQAACALSMFGSLLIILSYLLFADLRTSSRLLLVFLSLMDFGTALSNSIGMARGYRTTTIGCQVQAAFAIFCSLSSYLWTAAIAVYLYLTIVREHQVLAKNLVKIFHIFAWGIPAVTVAVAGGIGVLGYDATKTYAREGDIMNSSVFSRMSAVTVTGGWCYIRSFSSQSDQSSNGSTSSDNGTPEWYTEQWYQFWVMMAGGAWEIAIFLFCLVIYVLIKVYLYREKYQSSQTFVIRESLRVVESVDRKLTFIPIVFFLLYIWTIIRAFGKFAGYTPIVNNTGLMILEGLGDCLQGAVNCLMFCVFTKAVRNHFISGICSCCRSVSPCSTGGRNMTANKTKDPRLVSDVYGRHLTASGSISNTSMSRRTAPSWNIEQPDIQDKDVFDWPDHGYLGSTENAPLLSNGR